MSKLFKLFGVILICGLLFSAGLLFNEYKIVDRWQIKGLHLYCEQKSDAPCPDWLKQSPIIIALGLWINLLGNSISLILSLISVIGMVLTRKKVLEEVLE
jgi:hypothetical protein